MHKIRHRPGGVLTVQEARDQGVQLSDDVESACGVTKDKRDPEKKVLVRPADFVIDRFNFIDIDLDHVAYKRKH